MAEESVAQDQIKAFVDRILRLKEEVKAINSDIREIYAEAKGNGFDKTVLGKLVNYVEKRNDDANAVMEDEALFDLYLTAYDSAKNRPHAHAYARAAKHPPDHDAETGEITEPQSAPQAAQAGPDDAPVASTPVESAAAEISTPIHEPTAPKPHPEGQGHSAPAPLAMDSEFKQQPAEAKTVVQEPSEAEGSGGVQDECAIHSATKYAAPGVVVMETVPPVGIVAHPFAACWPVNNIDVAGGVREPIVKIGNLILDGRGRYFAARAALIEYPVVQYDGDDELADCIRWNMASRTMSDSALRLVAQKLAKAAPDRADEILERMGLSEDRQAAE